MTRHTWISRNADGLRYRAGVASRAVAAIGGGYALAAAAAALLALYLPTDRAQAAITGTLASLVIYPIAVMWVFAARTARHAWAGLLIPGGVLAASLLLHYFVGSGS